MNALDLNLLPLVRRAGQDQSSLPGLYAVNPPRRAARGRTDDQLILYLTLTGGAPWSSEQQTQLLSRTAQVYYETTGAVTTAARSAIEFLNQFLLDRNLRAEGGKRQGAGWFTLVVVRAERLYLAQAGRMRAFTITAEGSQEISDPDSSGQGLGLSRPPVLRYFQVDLKPESYVLLVPVMPNAWQESGLRGIYSQGLESMRRRLLGQAGTDLAAVLLQTLPGEGKMRLLWPKTANGAPLASPVIDEEKAVLTQSPPPSISQPETPSLTQAEVELAANEAKSTIETTDEMVAAGTDGEDIQEEGESLLDASLPVSEESDAVASYAEVDAAFTADLPSDEEDSVQPVAAIPAFNHEAVIVEEDSNSSAGMESDAPFEPLPSELNPGRRLNDQPAPRPARQRVASNPSPVAQKLKTGTKTFLAAFGRALKAVLRAFGHVLKRILPDESLFNIPSSVMIFLAIAVPLVVSVIGGMIFIKRGLTQQASEQYIKAVASAQEARAQTDPMAQRVAWEETLKTVGQAEDFDQENADIQALKAEASAALDQLNKVKRLVYQSALVEPINQSLNIIQMTTTEDDLYMLTDAQGSVLRALQTSTGYKPDTTFNCGPGTYGTRAVGKLVDIVPLQPGGEFNATILGMDSNANLLYCIPHERPKAIGLTTPSMTGWGKPSQLAIDLDSQSLYVLDPVKGNVWIYENLKITDEPIAFFDPTVDQIPALDNITDMAVNRTTLYLLHNNGQTTLCEFGRIAGNPNRCQSPVSYPDDRPGHETGPIIDGALFNAVQYAPPPDPSIFMLNPATQAVYQFGVLQLNFYYQYRPQLDDSPLPAKPATAFAINSSRTVFIAVGSEVYRAQIVP